MSTSLRPIPVVSTYDTALDVEHTPYEELDAYLRDLDVSRLKFVPGLAPTLFYIHPIPRAVMTRLVLAATSEAEQQERAFVYGVRRIENLVGMDGTTYPLIEARERVHGAETSIEYLGEQQLDLVAPVYIREVGQWALDWNSVSPKGGRRLRVRPFSQQGLMLLGFRRAGEAREEARRLNAAQSPRSRPRKPAPKSAGRGRARATAKATAGRTSRTRGKSTGTAKKSGG